MEEKYNDEVYPKLSDKHYWEYSPSKTPFDYYYYIQDDDKDYHITANGLSVSFEDERTFSFDVCPSELYPDEPFKLTEEHLFALMALPLEKGEFYSAEEMEQKYDLFLKEVGVSHDDEPSDSLSDDQLLLKECKKVRAEEGLPPTEKVGPNVQSETNADPAVTPNVEGLPIN